MKTATRWGDPSTNIHTFRDTPFGTVILNNFQKTAPEKFAIWLTIPGDGGEITITWWDCTRWAAAEYFGIGLDEQNMWGE